MSSQLPGFTAVRARSFVFRLPLFTRCALGTMLAVAVLSLQPLWDVRAWAALVPSKVSLVFTYRVSTFSFVHANLFHLVLDVLALSSLMERFESAHGTLMTTSLFFGPLTSVPATLFLLIERVFLRRDTALMGASVWIFVLLGIESVGFFRSSPFFVLGDFRVPTWSLPIFLIVTLAILVPKTSLIGHLCGLGIGYLYGLGYLKFINPPEKMLRWVETRLNLLARLPHYVSVDQKTYGRFGVLPSLGTSNPASMMGSHA